MRKPGADRIWPEFVTTVGGLIERAVIVRFVCLACRDVFDVDLQAVAAVRGKDYCLLDLHPTCKRSRCRGQGSFVMAEALDQPFIKLAHRPLPDWLRGLRPCDIEGPTGGGYPPGSPASAALARSA